ncbi:MAG: nitroreductase [Chloroflexi bacterium]|nr:nitroreductase [Chloroflexota bacterium]
MNVVDALNSRYSARAFKADRVDKETLLKIVAAANRAPSWGDTQPWEVFVAGGEVLDRLRRAFVARYDQGEPSKPDLPRPQSWPPAFQQRMSENSIHRYTSMGVDYNDQEVRRATTRRNYEFFGAPALAYLCMDRTLSPWSIFDLGMFAQSLMMAAQEFGVDSVPAVNLVAYPDLIRQELQIPENLMVLFGVALGYGDPDDLVNKPRSLRRPVEDMVRLRGF